MVGGHVVGGDGGVVGVRLARGWVPARSESPWVSWRLGFSKLPRGGGAGCETIWWRAGDQRSLTARPSLSAYVDGDGQSAGGVGGTGDGGRPVGRGGVAARHRGGGGRWRPAAAGRRSAGRWECRLRQRTGGSGGCVTSPLTGQTRREPPLPV